MELKPIKHYYGREFKNALRDGDNSLIKKYTTVGFKKSYQMWEDYSHDSIYAFFNDFIREYPEEYLKENCERCREEFIESGLIISFNLLFDILIRRLVIDAYIGFKSEDIVREKLMENGVVIHNPSVLSRKDEVFLDINCGIDIITFDESSINAFIQVKNTSTFSFDGKYITKKRKEFFEKEKQANDFINDGLYRPIMFYIYDKDAFINEGVFRFYVNSNSNTCHFRLDELINGDGTLKISVKDLKARGL